MAPFKQNISRAYSQQKQVILVECGGPFGKQYEQSIHFFFHHRNLLLGVFLFVFLPLLRFFSSCVCAFCHSGQVAMSGAATSAAKGLVKRGAFILFEGCDRSGKSTQVAKLVQRLQADGSKVEAMRFPDRTTEIGKMIDAYLRCATHLDDRAVHLLFSANRWECRARILSLLEQGTSIVCDRYTFSGVAFSASKVGMDVEWCKAPDDGLPAPDVVFFSGPCG
eukprot:INCI16902.1.p1 GENE.INCI16902.1~~INCI16902.1.p1  ORF type:complete len:222 (+),score=37.24 INCI16902.1:68-733(+)